MPCGIILPWAPCFWASRANDLQTQPLGPYRDVGLAFWHLNPTTEVKTIPGHPSRHGEPSSEQDEVLPFLKFRPFTATAWTLTHWKRTDSLEKTLMLGKIEGGRRRGRQRKDEMVGWHHRLNGPEFEQTPGVGDGQGGLRAAVHGVTESWTRLSDWTELWTLSVSAQVALPTEASVPQSLWV